MEHHKKKRPNALWDIPFKEWKDKLQSGRKYLEIMYLIKHFYLGNIKHKNSIMKRINGKMNKIHEQVFHWEGYSDDTSANEKIFNIFTIRLMQNKATRWNQYHCTPNRMAKMKKEKGKTLKDAKMRRNWISFAKGNVKWNRHSGTFL